MDNDKQKWKDALDKMSGYQAPDNKDLFWKIQLHDLPKYKTDKDFDFSDTPTSKKTSKRISLVIFAIVVVLLLLSLFIFIHHTSNRDIENKPLENIALDIKKDDLMNKTFESFCHDFNIACDDLYDTDIAQRWNHNQKSYQMTLEALAELGETDFLIRQLTYIRLNQTEMVTEIINNI